MLITSLPPPYQRDRMIAMIEHPIVGAVRYNTGMASAKAPYETLRGIKTLADSVKKPLYVDLKAKQLRIVEWADVPYGPIVLNHEIEVEPPAKVYFRGDDVCELREVARGNEIYVDPVPRYPVGNGQSINIVAKNLTIKKGLLAKDHEYIRAALSLGITRFMLSFTESYDDMEELEQAIEQNLGWVTLSEPIEIVLKIESQAGVNFVERKLKRKRTFKRGSYRLMAARDDLLIQIGIQKMPIALQIIAERDPHAICASRLLMGLESGGAVSMADVSDIEYMQILGYQHFMLSDGISHRHSEEALKFWDEYIGA